MQWLETSNSLQIGKMQPASCSYSQEQEPDHQDAFRKRFAINADRCVAYLYTYPWGDRKTTQRVGKLQKLVCVSNEISFPLAVATTWSESGVKPRVRGAYRCKCVNVNLSAHPTGNYGTSHFHFDSVEPQLYRVIGIFRRCGIGNLNAFTVSWLPTQTQRNLLQQQETLKYQRWTKRRSKEMYVSVFERGSLLNRNIMAIFMKINSHLFKWADVKSLSVYSFSALSMFETDFPTKTFTITYVEPYEG